MTNIDFIPMFPPRPVECRPALVAVDALCVVLTVLADTTTLVAAVDVQGKVLLIDVRVKLTLSCMVVAVAS